MYSFFLRLLSDGVAFLVYIRQADNPLNKKSYTVMNDSKWLVSCDWLTLNYQTSVAYSADELVNFLSKDFRCEVMPYSTRHFRSVIRCSYMDYYHDVDALEIVSNPMSKILHPCLLQVKVSNISLYNGMAYKHICHFERLTGAKYVGISRIDICVDSDFQDIKNLTDGLRNRTILMKGNKKVQEYYSIDRKEGIDYEGVKFGSAVSAYTFKIYNKTKEINEESLKYYIIDYWKKNGFAEDSIVWRYEFSILDLDRLILSNGKEPDGRELLKHEYYLLEVLEYYRKKIKCVKVSERFFENNPKPYVRFTTEKEYFVLPSRGIEIPKKINSVRVGNKTRTAKACISMNLQHILNGDLNKYEAYNLLQAIFVTANKLHLNEWLQEKKYEDISECYKLYDFTDVRTGSIIILDLFGEDWVLSRKSSYIRQAENPIQQKGSR